MIEQCIWTFVLGNQMRALYEWLQTLPESLVLTRPALGLLYALARIYTNHGEAASARLQMLARGVGHGSDTQEGRSLLARLSGDLEEYVTLAQRALDLIRGMVSIDADKVWLGYAALARLQQAQGRSDQALATLDTFLQLAQQRHVAPVLLAQRAALRAQLARGDLPTAHHWAESSGLSANDVRRSPIMDINEIPRIP